mgnify:FL=1
MPKIGDKIGTVCPSKTTMVDRIRNFLKIRVLSSKLSPIIRVHDVVAGLIEVEVGLARQSFYCKKKGDC